MTLPHNAYVSVGLDFELLGGALVAAFILSRWRGFGQLRDQESDAVIKGVFQGARAGLIILAVEGLTDAQFTPAAHQATLWFMVGILYGRRALNSRRTRSDAEMKKTRLAGI